MIYSPYKASHHLKRIEQLRNKELIYPTQVQIDLTNECNHNCPYCFYRCAKNEKLNALFNEQDYIATNTIFKLLDEFKELGIPAVQYTGGGEPFKHPDIYSILERSFNNNLEVAIVSNGTLIDYHKIDLLKQCTWIRISVDAASSKIYGLSQGTEGNEFYSIIKIISRLVNICKKTTIGLSFVVNPMNYKEIVIFAKLAKNLGVANIRYSVAYTPRGIEVYKNIWNEIEKLTREAKHLQTKEFKVFDLINAHLENLDLKQKGYNFCGYQHFTAVIGADGIVYPCCTLKYNAVTGFGNIKDKSFKNIWLGEKRKKWLEFDHLKNVCDKQPCWMDSKNRFISYIISQDVPHVNYI